MVLRDIENPLFLARNIGIPAQGVKYIIPLKIDVVEPSRQLTRLALVEHVAAQLYTALSQRPGLEAVASEEIQRLIKSLADAAADNAEENNQNRRPKGQPGAVEEASNDSGGTPNSRRRTKPFPPIDQ